MAQITNLTADDSGLNPDYTHVRELEIDDSPLGSGGFGAVYPCRTVNGVTPALPLAIKILQDDGTGSAMRGFDTIGQLQERIREANEGRQVRGEPRLQESPVFQGLPLFRFAGRRNRQDVYGYAAYRLDTAGFVPFDTLTDNMDPSMRTDYLRQPLDVRLRLAADLAELFAALGDEIGFIHADLNPANCWINLATETMTVIDFDGGGLISGSGVPPTTFGKLGDWLAPEAMESLAQGGSGTPIPVNCQTDAWAVLVGISYVIFLCHPLAFLENLSPAALHAYFGAYRWPDIRKTDPGFNRDNAALYDWFLDQIGQLPGPVKESFIQTLEEGTFNPDRRVSPAQWRQALMGQGSLPVIHLFEADPPISAGASVVLRWWVENAREVEVLPGLGQVAHTQSRLVFPAGDTTYTLTAKGLFGTATATCTVQVQPSPAQPAPSGSGQLQAPGPQMHPLRMPGLHLTLPRPWTGSVAQRSHAPSAAGRMRLTGSAPHRVQSVFLALPPFPWQPLYRRLNAIRLHLR